MHVYLIRLYVTYVYMYVYLIRFDAPIGALD